MTATYGAAQNQLTNSGDIRTRVIPSRFVVTLVLFFWTAATTNQMLIKEVLSPTEYGYHDAIWPYPVALTGVVNGIGGITCICVLALAKLCYSEATIGSLGWWSVLMLLFAGFLEGVERSYANKAYDYLSVSTRTMLSTTGIIFLFIVAVCAGLERVNRYNVVAILVIMVGGILQVSGGASEIWSWGLAFMVISLVCGAFRWTLIQKIVQGNPREFQSMLSKVTVVAISKPVDCFVCLGMSASREHGAFLSVPSEAYQFFALCGILVALMVVADVIIVNLSSSVALGVVTMIGFIPTALAGVAINNEHCQPWQVVGFAVCIAGAFVYFGNRAGIIGESPTHSAGDEQRLPFADKVDKANVINEDDADKA